MKSGSAPHTTRSSTTIPTRSKPIVSWTSIAWAIATFVPAPSVDVARIGRRYRVSAEASKRPAKPPSEPITSGRSVFATHPFIRSTALSAASMSTPAAAYAPVAGGGLCTSLDCVGGGVTGGAPSCSGVVEDGQGAVDGRGEADLEQVLAEQALVGERDRVRPGEAGQAQARRCLAGGGD